MILAATLPVFPSGCAVLTPGPRLPTQGDSAMARLVLSEVLAEYWRNALERNYDLALANGLSVNLLPDLSQDSRKGDLRVAQRISRGLDRLNVAALSQGDYLTTLALRWAMDVQAEASAFYWGDFSLLSPVSTPVRNLTAVYRLHPLGSSSDAGRYLFFVEAIPFVFERIQSGLEERRAQGYVAPRAMVESAIAFYDGLKALGGDGPWRPSTARLAALDSLDQRVVHSEISAIVELRMVPALDSFVRYLRETYLPLAPETPGLWQYAGGKELYRHLLRRQTSLDVPPEEAHRVGLGELRRIDSTMTAVRRRAGWNPDARAFHDSLRRAIGSAPSLQPVIDSIAAFSDRLVPALAAQFDRLPVHDAIVRDATPAEALLWPDGVYLPASGADTIGTLLLTDRWRSPAAQATLASRTYRMLLPGRHLEAALTRGNADVGAFRRHAESPGFSEGWSQYAAALAGELGLYADPLAAYGRLLDEGEAAALLVIDTGVHYLGWSTAQARAVLGRYVLANEATVDSLVVERVINDPGRAGAGILGAREVAAMRAWMQREQGEEFAARTWHAEMLSLGALPLPIVGSHLEWWLYDTERRRVEAARAAALKAAAEQKAADEAKKATPKKPGAG